MSLSSEMALSFDPALSLDLALSVDRSLPLSSGVSDFWRLVFSSLLRSKLLRFKSFSPRSFDLLLLFSSGVSDLCLFVFSCLLPVESFCHPALYHPTLSMHNPCSLYPQTQQA